MTRCPTKPRRATSRGRYDQCTVNDLRQAGVQPSRIKLPDRGVHGNSHVMMMEKKQQQIADVIIAWFQQGNDGLARARCFRALSAASLLRGGRRGRAGCWRWKMIGSLQMVRVNSFRRTSQSQAATHQKFLET